MFCQLSDLHVMSSPETDGVASARLAKLKDALAALAAHSLPLDFCLLTGDLADTGQVAEYELLATLLESIDVPMFLMPGNHDNRQHMKSVFPDRFGGDGSCLDFCFVIDQPSYRIVAVDTSVEGCEHGWLSEPALDWLGKQLALRICPTAIALHHPPYRSGQRSMDDIALRNADALRVAIAPFPHVRRILCGHLHRTSFVNFHGVIASSVGSVAFEMPLELNSESLEWLNDVCGVVHIHHVEDGEFVTNQLMASRTHRVNVGSMGA